MRNEPALAQPEGSAGVAARRRLSGLRTNVFAALVGLMISFVLGTTLYGQVPHGVHGRGLIVAFGSSVVGGPVLLSLHAIVGTLIVFSAITALIRAVLARITALVVLTAIALFAVLLAWFAGSAFASSSATAAAHGMEWASAAAMFVYALILFVKPGSPADRIGRES